MGVVLGITTSTVNVLLMNSHVNNCTAKCVFVCSVLVGALY